MGEQKGFDNDLAAVASHIDEGVGSVMQMLRRHSESNSAAPTLQEGTGQTNAAATEHSANSKTIKVESDQRRRTSSRARAADEPPILQNVTTRLTSDSNQQLTDAALRQRLRKRKPDTRQGVLQDALNDWLAKHGYLK